MNFFAIASALILAAFAGVFEASASETYKEQYRAYVAAVESGDADEAIARGESAWLAAEKELGDSETTAILAYNYASLIYIRTPEKAIEPLNRVIALTGDASPIFGDEPPILMLRVASAASDKESRQKIRELRKMLQIAKENSVKPTLLSARGWLEVARSELSNNYNSTAIKYADIAVEQFEMISLEGDMGLPQALILSGVGRMRPNRNREENLTEAIYRFDRAIEFFPPQESIETFHPLLAATFAWHQASFAIAHSLDDVDVSKIHEKSDRLLGPNAGQYKWVRPRPPEESCQLEWENRQAPEYPSKAGRIGYVGAVLMGYHIDDSGRIYGSRVLAEVPSSTKFAENALKVMESWNLKPGFNGPEGCFRNITTSFNYVFEN